MEIPRSSDLEEIAQLASHVLFVFVSEFDNFVQVQCRGVECDWKPAVSSVEVIAP